MKPKLEDRRVRRTKKLLKESFIELMSEKQIKDITVKDLTEHADLNRGTFYLHYLDIYDLLNQLEDEVIENVSMMIQDFNFRNSNQSTYLLLEQLFEYIYDTSYTLIVKYIEKLGKFSTLKRINSTLYR